LNICEPNAPDGYLKTVAPQITHSAGPSGEVHAADRDVALAVCTPLSRRIGLQRWHSKRSSDSDSEHENGNGNGGHDRNSDRRDNNDNVKRIMLTYNEGVDTRRCR
jgi:hypothetical protein